MNELLKSVGRAIGADDLPEAEPNGPSTVRPPAPGPGKPPALPDMQRDFEALRRELEALRRENEAHRAVDMRATDFPWSFVRGMRTLAEQIGCVEAYEAWRGAVEAVREFEAR